MKTGCYHCAPNPTPSCDYCHGSGVLEDNEPDYNDPDYQKLVEDAEAAGERIRVRNPHSDCSLWLTCFLGHVCFDWSKFIHIIHPDDISPEGEENEPSTLDGPEIQCPNCKTVADDSDSREGSGGTTICRKCFAELVWTRHPSGQYSTHAPESEESHPLGGGENEGIPLFKFTTSCGTIVKVGRGGMMLEMEDNSKVYLCNDEYDEIIEAMKGAIQKDTARQQGEKCPKCGGKLIPSSSEPGVHYCERFCWRGVIPKLSKEPPLPDQARLAAEWVKEGFKIEKLYSDGEWADCDQNWSRNEIFRRKPLAEKIKEGEL